MAAIPCWLQRLVSCLDARRTMSSIDRASSLFKYTFLTAWTTLTNLDRGCQVRTSAIWANTSSELVNDTVNIQKVPTCHGRAAAGLHPFLILAIPALQNTFFAVLSSKHISRSASMELASAILAKQADAWPVVIPSGRELKLALSTLQDCSKHFSRT